MLENGDLKVPLNLPNRSSTVQGRIRVFRDEDESCLEAQLPEALEKESGSRFNEHGLLVRSALTSRFVDPTVIPEVEESPELMRTTLVKRGSKCESMMKKDELDEKFFDGDAVVPSITIFSYEPAPPEDMGFFAPGNRKRKKWGKQSRRLPLLHRKRIKTPNVNYS